MLKSIRARITLAYIGVWAAILVASAAGVYLYVGHQLRYQVDLGLASCVQVIGQSLTHEVEEHGISGAGEEEFASLLTTIHHKSFPRQGISVFQGSRLIAQKAGDSDTLVARPPAGIVSEKIGFQSSTVEQVPLRIATGAVSVSGFRYAVVAEEPETSVALTLSSLRTALILLVALALLLSVAGGYAMARYALRPVVDMAADVDQISVRNLSQNIELLNPNDELGHLGATFNRLLSRLHAAFEQERQFMADASHELRTPLSVSLLSAQVTLERPRSAEEYRDSLTTIRSQLERLSRLVRDMLTLARSDAGGMKLNRRLCRVDELILEGVRTARVLARNKQIRLEVADLPDVSSDVDPETIHQLTLILLDNAIKYSAPGTTIFVSLRCTDGNYEMDVRDEGPGIPPEARSRIFDRFYRVDSSRAGGASGGAGLGLPIAKRIAQAHDGSIELVESSVRGSTFRIRMPHTHAVGIPHANAVGIGD